MRETPARMGVADLGPTPLDPDNEAFIWKARDKVAILAAVKETLTPEQAEGLISDLEFAINMALIRAEKWKVSRAAIKETLRLAEEAAERLKDALDAIPVAGRSYFKRSGTPWAAVRQHVGDVWTATTRAAEIAKEVLSGPGADPDPGPAILARDIADAIAKVGVRAPITRPKLNREGEPSSVSTYWKVSGICFRLCQFGYDDMHSAMKKARQIKIE